MSPYVISFLFLWVNAFLEVFKKKNSIIGFVWFFIFLSSRFQTGYDWPLYEIAYNSINDYSFHNFIAMSAIYNMEVGFVALMGICKFFVNDFQCLIILISMIEVYSLRKFLLKYAGSPGFALGIIFSFLVFTLFFSTLRQGLAVSCFLLFMCTSKKSLFKRIVYFFLSINFQISSLVYFLIFFYPFKIKVKKNALIIFIVCLMFSFFSEQISSLLFRILESSSVPFLSNKASWYLGAERGSKQNIYNYLYSYIYAIPVFCYLYKYWDIIIEEELRLLSFFYVLSLLLFVDYPLIHNRIMYVGFIAQACLVSTTIKDACIVNNKLIQFFISLFLSFSFMCFILLKSTGIVFIPYQDYFTYDVLGYFKSTGYDRQKSMVDLNI